MTSILIVDDSYTTRLKTELVLRHVGRYRVQSASNGYMAVRMAHAHPPDAIVLNVAMAGMNGIATLRSLRARGVSSLIIAYTDQREQYPGEFVSYGFDAYVERSDGQATCLLRLLQTLLSEQAAPQRSYPLAKVSSRVA